MRTGGEGSVSQVESQQEEEWGERGGILNVRDLVVWGGLGGGGFLRTMFKFKHSRGGGVDLKGGVKFSIISGVVIVKVWSLQGRWILQGGWTFRLSSVVLRLSPRLNYLSGKGSGQIFSTRAFEFLAGSI